MASIKNIKAYFQTKITTGVSLDRPKLSKPLFKTSHPAGCVRPVQVKRLKKLNNAEQMKQNKGNTFCHF